MRCCPNGFALFEVVLGLLLLAVGGLAIGRGLVAATRAVADGRRWSTAAFLGASVAHELEAAYRSGAPGCIAPPAGSLGSRGARATWWTADSGGRADIRIELRTGIRPGSVDTIRGRVTCR